MSTHSSASFSPTISPTKIQEHGITVLHGFSPRFPPRVAPGGGVARGRHRVGRRSATNDDNGDDSGGGRTGLPCSSGPRGAAGRRRGAAAVLLGIADGDQVVHGGDRPLLPQRRGVPGSWLLPRRPRHRTALLGRRRHAVRHRVNPGGRGHAQGLLRRRRPGAPHGSAAARLITVLLTV